MPLVAGERHLILCDNLAGQTKRSNPTFGKLLDEHCKATAFNLLAGDDVAALPCLALPCLALPCLALPAFDMPLRLQDALMRSKWWTLGLVPLLNDMLKKSNKSGSTKKTTGLNGQVPT